MKSRTTRKFWRLFDHLPANVQERARTAFQIWKADPGHPSLQFRRVNQSEPVYSVQVGVHHRVLGLLEADTVTWFWIGLHDEYERLLGG